MIKEIIISRINHTNKVSQAGKSYIACGIMVTSPSQVEYWLNGFGDDITKSFAVGQTVELEVWEDEKFGWQFKVPEGTEVKCPNGNPPNLTTDGAMKLNNLEVALKALELRVLFLEGKDTPVDTETGLKGANIAPESPEKPESSTQTEVIGDDGKPINLPS